MISAGDDAPRGMAGQAALVGCAPYHCTWVTVWAVDGDHALVRAETAWHDTGWEGNAWRVVPVAALHHFSPGWFRFDAAAVQRALGQGWSRPFRAVPRIFSGHGK